MTRPARLLICGFGPFPGFPDNPAAQVVERLRAEGWAPADAQVRYALMPTAWSSSVATVLAALAEAPADGVLLVGVAGTATAFRVESQARNRVSLVHPDAEGALHPELFIRDGGPDLAPATAPVEAMAAAIAAAGLPVQPSDDAGDYLCNYTFYRVLAGASGPRVGFLHIPPPQPGLDLDALARGVRAAATAFASALVAEPLSGFA